MSIKAVNSPVALHRLDHRPRAFRRAGLGRHDHLRRASTTWCRGCGTAKRLYSLQLVNWHFWLATLGIVLYISAMWVSGIMQGLMWREYDAQRLPRVLLRRDRRGHASLLRDPRARAACCSSPGALIMAYNIWMTIAAAKPQRAPMPARRAAAVAGRIRRSDTCHVWTSTQVIEKQRDPAAASASSSWSSIGGIVEIAPLFYLENTIEKVEGMRPYTPLELAGRNIYIREGCYICHSQMIRPFRDEVERYGHYSPRGREHVRPPVPVGLEAHRAGPRARRRHAIPTTGTCEHLIDPRARGAGIDHAGLRLPGADRRSTPATSRAHLKAQQPRRRALHRRA